MARMLEIGGRYVGPGETLVVAEVGVNHNGDPALGHELVRQAHLAGCGAFKLQSYTAEKLAVQDSPTYWEGGGPSQRDLFRILDKLPADEFAGLLRHATELGMLAFSTPFDLEAVDELEALEVPCYKIASADITHHALLRKVAHTGKPVLLSTGASRLEEVAQAASVLHQAGCRALVLMGCTLNYPTATEDANLSQLDDLARLLQDMRSWFQASGIGYSDHTRGLLVPALAVAKGAVVIERHFTVDNGLGVSPDHRLSACPRDMSRIVAAIHEAEAALGAGGKRVLDCEQPARQLARRSLVSTCPIPRGTVITADMLTAKRPGTGIPADRDIVGAAATEDIPADVVITREMIAPHWYERRLAAS